MALELLSCPNCGAALQGNPFSQQFHCSFCGRTVVNTTAQTSPASHPGASAAPVSKAPEVFPAGTRVWAQWSGGASGRYYPGAVVRAENGGYFVAWDDGSPPSFEPAEHVLVPVNATPQNTAPGMHVAARWRDGIFYGAKLLQLGPQGFLVAWDDGTAPTWQGPGAVLVSAPAGAQSPASQGFEPGTHVRARWQHGNYYGAVVVAFNGSQYLLRWDDGTAPTWVPLEEVAPG